MLVKKQRLQPKPNMEDKDFYISPDDTITIDVGDIDLSSVNSTYTLGGSGGYTFDSMNYNIGPLTTSQSVTWGTANTVTNPTVIIDTNGVNIKEGGDIKIGDKSLVDTIAAIEDRLAIFKPNPKLEDKWEQLKELRRQYEALEKDILEKEKIMKILKET